MTVSASLRASMSSRASISASACSNDSSSMRSTSCSVRPCDDFVRIQLAVRCAAEQLLDQAPHERDARGAADEHDFFDVLRLEAGISEGLAARIQRAIDQRMNQQLELRARNPSRVACRYARHRLEPDLSLIDIR